MNITNKQVIRAGLLAIWASVLMCAAPLMANEAAATLKKITGVVSVIRAGGRAVLAYEGLDIRVGDTVSTEHDSSAMLIFADKGQMVLRPDTRFQVKAFHYDEAKPNEDNAIFKLLKGGLRTVTGFISKRGKRGDAYRLEAATATIGIRGTDYTARLCDRDCEKEQAQNHPVSTLPSGAIGRVAEVTGELMVERKGGQVSLQQSQAFFEADVLTIGDTGHALLIFTDGSKILLQAGATMKMSQYHYEQVKPESGVMLFNLLKGTARVVSGLIGKKHPENVKFETITAVLGIRGTAFDLICGRKHNDPCDGELFVNMRDGKTFVSSGQQSLDVNKGQTSYVAGPGSAPVLIDEIPAFIRDNPNPKPEEMKVDTKALFGMGYEVVPAGLYASVNDGRIVLIQGGKTIEIGKGEAGFAPVDGSEPLLFRVSPLFMDYDNVLADFPFIEGYCSMN